LGFVTIGAFVVISNTANAQGYPEDGYYEQEEETVESILNQNSSRIPGGRHSGNGNDIFGWCQNQAQYLFTAKMTALNAYRRGHVEESTRILYSTLVEAQRSIRSGYESGALTAKAITRVKNMAQYIASGTGRNIAEKKAISAFLFKGYDFIINVANTLDIPYFIPYYREYGWRRCNDCGSFDIEELEAQYIQFARDQLALAVEGMSNVGSNYVVNPLGGPRTYLLAVELAANAAIGDLNDSFWRTEYACEIRQLRELAGRLGYVNRMGATSPRVYFDQVQQSHAEGQWVIEQIGEGCEGSYKTGNTGGRHHKH
jgi:hypothetical protein